MQILYLLLPESFNLHILNRLDTLGIHQVTLILYFCKVNHIQIYTTNVVVVSSLVINATVGQVSSCGPLSGTGQVGGFSQWMLQANGDIEVVQQMETESDSGKAIRLLGCGVAQKCSTYKTGGRGKVARQAQHARTSTYMFQCHSAQFMCGSIAGIKVYVVVQIGHLPWESGRIGDYAHFVFIKMRYATVQDFQYYLPSVRLADAPMYGRCHFGVE